MAVVFTQDTATWVKEVTPNTGVKILQVRLPATFVGGTDSLTVDLTRYGANNVTGVLVFRETTAGSAGGLDAVHAGTGSETGWTYSVTAGVLTITPLLPATTCVHNAIIFAY